jgi:hypothetical protein
LVNSAEWINALVGNRGHSGLGCVRKRRVGSDAREPREERAFTTALVADEPDFHGPISRLVVFLCLVLVLADFAVLRRQAHAVQQTPIHAARWPASERRS